MEVGNLLLASWSRKKFQLRFRGFCAASAGFEKRLEICAKPKHATQGRKENPHASLKGALPDGPRTLALRRPFFFLFFFQAAVLLLTTQRCLSFLDGAANSSLVAPPPAAPLLMGESLLSSTPFSHASVARLLRLCSLLIEGGAHTYRLTPQPSWIGLLLLLLVVCRLSFYPGLA